jgi:hypothetical protein
MLAHEKSDKERRIVDATMNGRRTFATPSDTGAGRGHVRPVG